MGRIRFEIRGVEQLRQAMSGLGVELKEAAGMGVDESADYLANEVKFRAPGSLHKAVKTKKLPDKEGWPKTTLVGLDYKIAPHQHLVEFGSGPRHHKSGKSTGSMPASGFFRKSIENTGYIVKVVEKHAKGPVKRRGG